MPRKKSAIILKTTLFIFVEENKIKEKTMKLAYILNSRMPTERAYGIQVVKMCEAFAKSGVKVTLLYPRRENEIKEDIFSYYDVEECFQTRELFSIDLLKCRFLGKLVFWLGAASFYFAVFFYFLFNLRNFEFVYTRDFYAPLILGIFGKKIISEIHNLPNKSYLFKFFLKGQKGIVAITKILKNDLQKLGVPSEEILYLPDGVDLQKFDLKISKEEAREKLKLPRDKKLVLYAGHLYEWKGATTLLKVAWKFQIPNSKFQDVLFVFVGGKREDIKNFSSQVGFVSGDGQFLKNVLLVGHRPHQEIPYWLKSADVLVLPNSGKELVSRFYTSPLKLFEYMASGRPIVASNLPAIMEILNDNNAILVKPDDPEALAEGIEKALRNQELSTNLSAGALKDIQSYSWQKRAGKIINFIKLTAKYVK